MWHGRLPRRRPRPALRLPRARPYDPRAGLRHNPAKLLLDPYARAVDGELRLHPALFGYPGDAVDSPTPDPRDSESFVPRGVVVHDDFPWGGDRRPATSWSDTVIYEAARQGLHHAPPRRPAGAARHLRRARAPGVRRAPAAARASPRSSCCRCTTSSSEPHLLRRGLTNYWGYNTLGYFAPHAAYSALGSGGEQVTEFKAMVKALHAAGIEVILDVVYNHTAEGGHTGPTLSLRGIDNPAYYRLAGGDRARYTDYTGCGNTLDVRPPGRAAADHGLAALLGHRDARRRLPLRPGLGARPARCTTSTGCRPSSTSSHQDPVVSQVKLIAEPWDVGDGGYQVGNFPPPWTEWNGRYRDTVRDVLARRARSASATSRYRLTGSSDLYRSDGRRPSRASTSSPRTTASPCADLVSLRAQAQRGQRRGQPRRRRAQPQLELRRRGPDRRPRGPRAARAPDAQPAGHAAAVHRRADAHRRRRARTHPARQQQRLLPGQRGLLDRLGVGRPGPARLRHAACCGCGAARRCCGRRPSSRAARCPAPAAPATSRGSPPAAAS